MKFHTFCCSYQTLGDSILGDTLKWALLLQEIPSTREGSGGDHAEIARAVHGGTDR